MTKKAAKKINYEGWATAVGRSVPEVKAAWQALKRRGLVSEKRGRVVTAPLAMRRATSDTERRLTAHLSGYVLTENSFIVRRAGDPPGKPYILNTRLAVEHIANYFKEGWGVTDIARDLNLLTREEIEAAIQYYLNHRTEIDQNRQHSRELYEAHAPRQETLSA